MESVLKENAAYRKLDEVTAKAISGILKMKVDLTKIMKTDEEGNKVYDMCQAFEDYREEGKREGRQEIASKLVKI